MRHFGSGISAAACLAGLLCAQPAAQLHQTLIGNRLITYEIRGGYAITEGDIILGTAAELAAWADAPDGALAPRSVAISTGKLWPGGVLTYTVDSALTATQQQWVQAGVDYWNANTPLKIRPRASEANYVRFVYDPSTEYACSSFIGVVGGQQTIAVTLGCSVGSMIHEIGHAFGLLHEQSRADRNAWLTVLYENIDKRYASNFDQNFSGSRDYGYFDYDSDMLYGASGFSRNFQDTIETVPVGIPIGQRNGLSAGDIDAVSRLYGFVPSATTITTAPAGLTVIVDGVSVQSPASFPWAAGSTHTIQVNSPIGPAGADPRYAFVRWSDGGQISHSVTADPSRTVLCAVFQAKHLLTMAVGSGGGSATATPASADGYYPERQPVTVVATPSGSNQFVRWSGATNLNSAGFGVSSSPATVEVASANRQYTASFTSLPLAIVESQPTGQVVTIDGTAYMTPARVAWTVGSAHTLGVAATQYANNDTARYQLTGWEDGSTAATRRVTFTGSTTYSAGFKTQYVLTTSHAGSGSVTVSPASSDGYYDAGSKVQVTATPAAGWALRYWLGDLVDSMSPHALVMDQQRAVTAFFGSGAALAFTPLSAASYRASPSFTSTGFSVAPGELLTIFFSGIGPDTTIVGQSDAQGLLPRILGDMRVLFDGVAAPLIYVGKYQLSVIVPAGVAGKTNTMVELERNGAAFGSLLSMNVTDTAPAFFTLDSSGTGQAAALNQDNSTNSPSNPAAPGSVIQMWATGAGLLARSIPDGLVMTDMGALAAPVAPVYVRLGKLPAQIQYAGSAPWLVNGVVQVNVWIPNELIGDPAVPVQLIIGDYASPPGTTIAVK